MSIQVQSIHVASIYTKILWRLWYNSGGYNGPYPQWRQTDKNGRDSCGTSVKFVWATMGGKFLNDDISANIEDTEV